MVIFHPMKRLKRKIVLAANVMLIGVLVDFVIIMTQKLKEIMKDTISSRRIISAEIKSKM